MKTQPAYVPPTEGYLALVTTRGATVTLKNSRKVKVFSENADEQGVLKRSKLLPGRYSIEIARKDFVTVTDSVLISKGKQTPFVRFLVSQYGDLTFSLPGQAERDISVELGNEKVEASRLTVKVGQLLLARVPVGEQRIKLKKPGYDDLEIMHVVQPGQCDNLIPARFIRPSVTLVVVSEPNAEVYLRGERSGIIDPSRRELVIRDLVPGVADLVVRLDGYETAEQNLNLRLEEPLASVKVKLNPLVEDIEFQEFFDSQTVNHWAPAMPKEWKLETKLPVGLMVLGDQAALANNTDKAGRQFNVYKNFDLFLTFRMADRKGAAWIVRAQPEDGGDYYLFELSRQQRELALYVCQDGECKRSKQSYPVLVDLDDPNSVFRIRLKVRDSRFQHLISTEKGWENFGGTFIDDTYSYGGVGLRAVNGIQMFVTEFAVLKPQD